MISDAKMQLWEHEHRSNWRQITESTSLLLLLKKASESLAEHKRITTRNGKALIIGPFDLKELLDKMKGV